MAAALTAMKNEQDNARLARLANEMFRRFGGMDGFLDAWAAYHRQAMEQGGFAAYRCFESVIRLLRYCEETQREPAQMADNDLERAFQEQTKQLIQRNPKLAITAAQELGWTVIPPHAGANE